MFTQKKQMQKIQKQQIKILPVQLIIPLLQEVKAAVNNIIVIHHQYQ